MNDLTQMGFDYAALPVDAALNARDAAERIKLRLKRTLEDIIEIGRELTAVKDELPHGHFLPWIAAEFEMSEDTATNFMNVCSRFGQIPKFSEFKPSVLYLLAAPKTPESIIDKALEKAESGEKVTVADVKDWKAHYETERQARQLAEQRSEDWRTQAMKDRDEKRAAEQKVLTLESQPVPKPQIIEKAPDDYEDFKRKAAEFQQQTDALQAELVRLQKQQAKLVNDQVRAKLQERQAELDEMERKKSIMEEQVVRMKTYMASLDSEAKRIEVHQSVINGVRLELISLAAFLNDLDPISDKETIKKWLALAGMHEEAKTAICMVFGKPVVSNGLLETAP